MAFTGIGRLPMAAIARARLEQLSTQLLSPEQPQKLITARLGMHSRLAVLRASCEQLVQVLAVSDQRLSLLGCPVADACLKLALLLALNAGAGLSCAGRLSDARHWVQWQKSMTTELPAQAVLGFFGCILPLQQGLMACSSLGIRSRHAKL